MCVCVCVWRKVLERAERGARQRRMEEMNEWPWFALSFATANPTIARPHTDKFMNCAYRSYLWVAGG